MNKSIMIVDDDIAIQKMLSFTVKKIGYEPFSAYDISEGIDIAKQNPLDLILMDVTLPPHSGFAAVEKLKSDSNFHKIPILMITSSGTQENLRHSLVSGADGFIPKPFQLPILIETLGKWSNVKVEEKWEKLDTNQERVLKLTLATMQKIFSATDTGSLIPFDNVKETCSHMTEIVSKDGMKNILDSVKDHDSYTFVHSLRVAIYLVIFARHMGFDEEKVQKVAQGGLLHDVGKVHTPTEVLNKPGALEETEWLTMKEHVDHTVELLSQIPDLPQEIIEIAGNHHEKVGGRGYPRGICGDELSELSRMAAIVDAYVALTDRRCYKPSHSSEKALEMMKTPVGHLDLELLSEFKKAVQFYN
jgi:putative nucleotidyltransferase with HDIG domain